MISLLLWMITGSDNFPEFGQYKNTTINQQDDYTTGFSLALHVLLPVVGLVFVCVQKDIFNKLLLQLDRSCVSVFCPSFSNREKLLKWASHRLPSRWSSQSRTLSGGILELWEDGSLLCTLINSAVPGACPNPHRHWKRPPIHAQIIAFKYFGVTSVFAETDLSGDLTINLERDFILYLQELQQAINKWQRDESNHKFSSQYVARGMGLYTGEQHRKTIFYIYSNITTKKRSNVLMYIRGPYGSKGKATISPFHNLKAITTVNVLQEADEIMSHKNDKRKSFLKKISLDLTTFIGQENKETNNILIKTTMEINRAKITYIPEHSGMYEINLISDGDILGGCPYYVHIVKNNSKKVDSFKENNEQIQNKTVYSKRKTLSRVIDCIDEKILVYTFKNNQANPITECARNTRQENNHIIQSETNYNCLENITEEYSKKEYFKIENDQNDELNKNVIYKNDKEFVLSTNFFHKLNLNSIKSSKYLKNVVNNSSKEETEKILLKPLLPKTTQQKNSPQNPITNTLSIKETRNSFEPKNASPICPNQIVPEVNCFRHMAINEKRTLFSHRNDGILNESLENSSFSESENDEGSKSTTDRELRVLNHLNSIRQPQENSLEKAEPKPFSSTTSLPNMISLESNNDNLYRAKIKYWETMTSCNSINQITNEDITKSTGDLVVRNYLLNCKNLKRYKSMDDSLENCAILSVKERKRMLLKNQNEKDESIIKLRFNLSDKQKQDKRVLETINKFNEITAKQIKPKEMLKSQFKRAINYFKNLEENSNKIKTKKICRRLSLNNEIRKRKEIEKGSSLKLSNISHSFPLNNFYDKVLEDTNANLKVAAKQNVSSTLFKLQQNDDINFSTFICKSRYRKRRSVKSLFDIC